MSGLETAIRNALDRADRTDSETRARIYQSARQALEAGLRKQGISDRLIIMQQHELLERKIHEIEMDELRRLSEADPAPSDMQTPRVSPSVDPNRRIPVNPPVAPAPPVDEPNANLDAHTPAHEPAPAVAVVAPRAQIAEPSSRSEEWGRLDTARPERLEAGASAAPVPDPSSFDKRTKPVASTTFDAPPDRIAKPRRRRGFLSHLITWLITLAVVAGLCWGFYRSGMVQGVIEEAMRAADRATSLARSSGQGPAAFDPRSGFSEDWIEIFGPSDIAALKPGGQAQVAAVAGSEGEAARIVSSASGEEGDVAIEVPPEVLREMAGRSSTIALTLQSGQDRSAQLSVRCDFGSLGNCSRHRFTATQEKQDALFRVAFERSLAPNRPGRLILNSGLGETGQPVLLYSVRILPGQ